MLRCALVGGLFYTDVCVCQPVAMIICVFIVLVVGMVIATCVRVVINLLSCVRVP